MSRKLALIALALVSGYSVRAMAYDFGPASMFSLNGFGTIDEVHSNTNRFDFSNSSFQPRGAGFTEKWSPQVDSLLGLQATANYGHLKAVVQAITKQDPDNHWRPVIEWANLKYSFTSDFSIKAGRFAMPTYMGSDTRLLHYANTAVRPSTELYRLLPVTTTDGADISYSFNSGPIKHTARVVGGKNTTRFANGVFGNNKGIWAWVDDMEYGDFTAHLAYQLRQNHLIYPPPTKQPVQTFKIADIGFNYDNGKWFVLVEGARTWLHPILSAPALAYMINGGMRFGKFTPYLQYGKLKALDDTLTNGGRSAEGNTKTAGLRWDFYKNICLKTQYDHATAQNGTRGNFIRAQPGAPVNGTADVISIALDFVF